MAYRIAAISMTLSDFQGHSPIAILSSTIFRTPELLILSYATAYIAYALQ